MATINGDDGANVLTGTDGPDTINGLGGNDIIEGLAGGDQLLGGLGFDTLSYATSNFGVHVFLGPTGNLAVGTGFGHAGSDTGDGFENLLGSTHDDLLAGNNGNNIIEGGAGEDEMYGNGGIDTLSYSRSAVAVFVVLKEGNIDIAGDGDAEGDFGEGFENLTGSGFNDTLIGDSFANIIRGGAGRDNLYGGGGGDQLFGELGDDNFSAESGAEFFDGGDGRDLVSYFGVPGVSGVSITLGKNGTESVGVGGNAEGDRIRNIEDVNGSDFVDVLKGNEADNALIGFSGNDTIKGRGGKDFLSGGGGDDLLSGGGGKDSLFGDLGNDTLKGGGGKDRFYFTETPGPSTVGEILDFVPKGDSIELRNSAFYTIPAGNLKPSAFEKGKKAQDAEDRIIFNKKTGDISFDLDGKGGVAQIVFAHVDEKLKLTADDFFVA